MQGCFGGEFFMSQVRLVATALFFGLCCNGSSSAMNFEAHVVSAGVAIKATGAIRTGDAEKLQALVPATTVDEKGLRRINLESPGGEVAEALRVAEIIRSNNFMTVVTGECASACAMVLYPAGQYAMLLEGGRLGFHSCYDARTSIAHPECTELIAKFAASNGFPYGSIKVFAGLSGPADMYWVSNVLAYCYGMEHFIGDPAPTTVSTLCPTVARVLLDAKFREPDRPLGPSFDCKKADSPPERLLCRDEELMHLDALMGQLYRMMRKREGRGSSSLLSTQRAWIVERDKKCDVSENAVSTYKKSRQAAQCFSEMTMARMDELLRANGTPRLNLSPLIDTMKKEDLLP
jgi:uncharacterized protein YecT (DUF1311 family)